MLVFFEEVPRSELRPFWMDFLTKPCGVTWAEVLSPSTASTVSCSHTISHDSKVNKGASFKVLLIFKILPKKQEGSKQNIHIRTTVFSSLGSVFPCVENS